jgi:hypothetical protein
MSDNETLDHLLSDEAGDVADEVHAGVIPVNGQ